MAAMKDLDVFPGIGPDEDIRGDSLTLMLLSLSTLIYFSTFDAPLKRSELDGAEEAASS